MVGQCRSSPASRRCPQTWGQPLPLWQTAAPTVAPCFRRPANLLFMSPHIARAAHPRWSPRLENTRGNCVKGPRPRIYEFCGWGYSSLLYFILSLHQETQEKFFSVLNPRINFAKLFFHLWIWTMSLLCELAVWKWNVCPTSDKCAKILRHNSVHEPHRGFKLISLPLFSFCPNFLHYLLYRAVL